MSEHPCAGILEDGVVMNEDGSCTVKCSCGWTATSSYPNRGSWNSRRKATERLRAHWNFSGATPYRFAKLKEALNG